MKFSTIMPDVPGALENFASIIASQNANIIMFQHDRVNANLDIDEAIVHVVCEVGGVEHGKALLSEIEKHGYQVLLNNN